MLLRTTTHQGQVLRGALLASQRKGVFNQKWLGSVSANMQSQRLLPALDITLQQRAPYLHAMKASNTLCCK